MRVAHFVDAMANVSQTCDGGEVGEAPCPAQDAEPPLWLGRLGVARRPSDGLAQGNLVLDGARGPLSSVGDKRRALCGEGAAADLRHQVGGSKGPHGGSHCDD